MCWGASRATRRLLFSRAGAAALRSSAKEVAAQVISNVGRLFVSIGLTLLVLSLLVRLAHLSSANRVGDDLAIITSALVVAIGAVASRYGSR